VSVNRKDRLFADILRQQGSWISAIWFCVVNINVLNCRFTDVSPIVHPLRTMTAKVWLLRHSAHAGLCMTIFHELNANWPSKVGKGVGKQMHDWWNTMWLTFTCKQWVFNMECPI